MDIILPMFAKAAVWRKMMKSFHDLNQNIWPKHRSLFSHTPYMRISHSYPPSPESVVFGPPLVAEHSLLRWGWTCRENENSSEITLLEMLENPAGVLNRLPDPLTESRRYHRFMCDKPSSPSVGPLWNWVQRCVKPCLQHL